jgi:hypothetical protein
MRLANERDIAVDPIILGELRFGILVLPKGRKRAFLERWFDAGVGRLHCLAWEAHRPEMGGGAGSSSRNGQSHADQG